MKKETTVLFFSYLIVTVILGIWGLSVIRGAYVNEIRTVQNLAGNIIARYPETENAFMEALSDPDRKNADAGADILIHYGYDEREKIVENKSYMRTVLHFGVFILVFFGLSFLSAHVFFHIRAKKKARQEEQILAVLDRFLLEDYHFLEEREWMEKLGNPWFGDMLSKLGKSLRLKVEHLAQEHDDTKTLVTDISHQLRTPVSALKVCFSLYAEAEEEAEKEEFFGRCSMQMDKLEALTEALTNISRLEMQMISLSPASVFLTDILTVSVNSVYHKARKKQISIETFFAADAPASLDAQKSGDSMLYLDEKWTVEALSNVLDNAVKYSPAGSVIRIRVQKMLSFVRIEIEDSGIGVPKEEQSRIFGRFYRGSSPAVKKEEGAGVGLYLSRKILEEQGGTIFVRPAKEAGSIFIVQLPYPEA